MNSASQEDNSSMIPAYRIITVSIFLSMCSCVLGKEVLLHSRAPSGSARVTLWLIPHAPDYSVAVSVTSKGSTKTVHRDYEDRLPGIAEVYWSSDSSKFGVLVCDSGGSNFLFAYNLVTSQQVNEAEVLPGLRLLLKERYTPTNEDLAKYGNDPIRWACAPESELVPGFRRELTPSLDLRPAGALRGTTKVRE